MSEHNVTLEKFSIIDPDDYWEYDFEYIQNEIKLITNGKLYTKSILLKEASKPRGKAIREDDWGNKYYLLYKKYKTKYLALNKKLLK